MMISRKARAAALAAMVLLSAASAGAQTTVPAAWVKRLPRSYHVVMRYYADPESTFDASKAGGYRQSLVLPLPTSCEYHEVSGLVASAGSVRTFLESNERYLAVESGVPIREVRVEYDIKVYQVLVDFSRIGAYRPYDRGSALWKRWTAKEGPLLDPENPRIKTLASGFAAKAKDPISYARAAYAWIQDSFKWAPEGVSSLDELFARGQGDCGSLSSLLVSLLRAKGIPARYLTGGVIEEDGALSDHMWTEFYVEGAGWIPADPSMWAGSALPYMGQESSSRLFFNRGSGFEIEPGSGPQTLQTWYFRHWYDSGSLSGEYRLKREVRIEAQGPDPAIAFYASTEFRAGLVARALLVLNARRAALKLAALVESPLLSAIAQELLDKGRAGEAPSAYEYMAGRGYRTDWYGSYSMAVYGDTLDPGGRLASFLDKAADDGRFAEIGIGLHRDPLSGLMSHFIILARPAP